MQGLHPLMRVINVTCHDPEVSLESFIDALDEPAQLDPHFAFRSRGFDSFTYSASSGDLILNPRKDFEQSGKYNALVKQQAIPKKRKFGSLPAGFADSPAVKGIIEQTMVGVAELRGGAVVERAELGLHFIKVWAREQHRWSTPAPEGRHQDGFDYVSITVLKRESVQGGESVFAESKDGEPFLSEALGPGNGRVLDDRLLWHDVMPIKCAEESSVGYRCVLVVTVTVPERTG